MAIGGQWVLGWASTWAATLPPNGRHLADRPSWSGGRGTVEGLHDVGDALFTGDASQSRTGTAPG